MPGDYRGNCMHGVGRRERHLMPYAALALPVASPPSLPLALVDHHPSIRASHAPCSRCVISPASRPILLGKPTAKQLATMMAGRANTHGYRKAFDNPITRPYGAKLVLLHHTVSLLL